MKKNYFLKVLLITIIGLGTNLYGQTTWTGNTDSNWNTSSNWDNGVPNDVHNAVAVIIPDVTNDPVITSTQAVVSGALTINSGATLTISSGGTLKQTGGTFTHNGSIIMNSGTELITNQSISGSGSFTYNRTLSTTNWYLISSPFEGQDIDVFAGAEGLADGSGTNNGLATYDTANISWTYYQDGASGSGNFLTGIGYSIKLASSGDITFTGSLLTTNKSVSLNTSSSGYNLIGNPYPVHINSGNILSRSSSALASQTIWLWNQAANTYQTKVTANNYEVAPAQAFFVKSDGSAGNLEIQEADQTFQSTDTFLRTDPRPEIHITLSDGSNSRQVEIYYIDGTTTGFDNGYDGPRFTAGDNSFAFYTHLVSDSEGVDYDIQSLPANNYENMVIPMGINAVSGSDITIDVSTIDFPEGINIYLEDKEDDSFTLLGGDANFTTTLANDLNGIGRFYLHTTTGSLSADDLLMNNNISIYNSSRENLRIVGVQNGTAKVQLYNILGKEVFSTAFEGTGVNDIQLPSLAEGLYIVNLSTVNGKTNKKIIIQ